MVKRKAEVSIDEWLGKRGIQPDSHPGITVAAEEGPTRVDIPVATVLVEPATTEPVNQATADVAAPVGEETEWFWELLEAAGYERW